MRWVKLSECDVPAVRREAERLRDEATGSLDIPGVYVSDTGTTYKVVYSAVERNSRGHVRRRQRTRNFPRRQAYGPVRLPDFGTRKHPTALEAAYAFKLKAEAASKAGQAARSDDVTVDDLFGMFLASKPRRPTTEAYYRATYRRHIEPTFGSWFVHALDVAAVERWQMEIDAKPAAKRAALQVFKAMTSYATRRGILEADPARSLVVPQNTVRALRPDEIPTPEQVERLATEVGDRYRALILLLAYGGLRIGEAVALRVDRLDFEARRITVDASASEVDGRLVFGGPKTTAGIRTFKAPAFLVRALHEHVERFPPPADGVEAGLIFTGSNGGPLRPGNFRRRVFDPAAKRAGLDGLRIHDLRHTAASTLAAEGASATEIAARLGHANAATTARVYLHLLAARDDRLAELQDAAYVANTGEARPA